MSLTNSDFSLSEPQLDEINRYIKEYALAYAASGEDAPGNVSITFDFMPAYGREVSVFFDGEAKGHTIGSI